jgi:hypothetical protein
LEVEVGAGSESRRCLGGELSQERDRPTRHIAEGREAEPGRELRRAQQALTVYLGALFEMERTLYSQHSPTKHLPASRRCQRFVRCRRGGR